jgi:nucleotide-binding universal stress UspA family protein
VLATRYPEVSAQGNKYTFYTENQLAWSKAHAKYYLKQVQEWFRYRGVVTRSEVILGSAAEKIIDYANSMGISFIAMSTHGRSGVHRWVMGGVADRVFHHGDTSLMLVRSNVGNGVHEAQEGEQLATLINTVPG